MNTGPVLAGVVGDRGHRIHGVFGDTVNLGSRLEGQAQARRDRDRRRHAASACPTRRTSSRSRRCTIKGKAEPVQAFILRGL